MEPQGDPRRPPPTWSRARSLTLMVAAILFVVAVAVVMRPAGTPPAGSGAPPASPPQPPPPTSFLYVSPAGSDSADGSASSPLQTIQAGLDRAEPGTQITLAPGVYREQLQTVRTGTPQAPIWIKGPEFGTDPAGRHRAVLYGTGRVVSIDHSHYVLDGFTIDGQEKLANVAFPTDLAAVEAFKNSVQPQVSDGRLVYVGADDNSRDVTGVRINDMFLSGAGGECVRLRNSAHHNTVTNSVIQYCGLHAKSDDQQRSRYHNGEGVYIGTSPKSKDQPMHEDDGSSFNVVAHNVVRPFGSECFNVKENAHDNVFTDNTCTANAEPLDANGSNVELRGYANVVRNNTISDSSGYSVKIASDDRRYDNGGNVVRDNRLSGASVAMKLGSAEVQGALCGNVVDTAAAVEAASPPDITAPC